MNIMSVTSPSFCADGVSILCLVEFDDGEDAAQFVASPNDCMGYGRDIHARAVSGEFGAVAAYVPVVPTQSEIIAEYERALDNHLDSVAKLHRYDTRFTFALRAGFPGPYHDEAVAFATWMDVCNVQAFALLSEVQAGNAVMPTIDAFIASLPEFSL